MNIEKAEAIALLAFLLMIKNAQPNSVLYEDAAYKMAARVGMGDGRTFCKYLKRCEEAELCTKSIKKYNINEQRTVYTFISYRQAVTVLLGINKYQMRHFPLHKELGKHTRFKKQIEKDLAGLNYSQQAYNIGSNFPDKKHIIQEIKRLNGLPVPEKRTRAHKRRMRSLVKKLATADIRIKESHLRRKCEAVVTGCCHLAKLIGKSTTTGNKRIKQWQKEKTLKVRDIVDFIPTHTIEHAFIVIDEFKASRLKGIAVYSPKEQGVKIIHGKQVVKFESASYSYEAKQLSRPLGYIKGKTYDMI